MRTEAPADVVPDVHGFHRGSEFSLQSPQRSEFRATAQHESTPIPTETSDAIEADHEGRHPNVAARGPCAPQEVGWHDIVMIPEPMESAMQAIRLDHTARQAVCRHQASSGSVRQRPGVRVGPNREEELADNHGRGSDRGSGRHSHSMVAGGLLDTSYATRLMPRTSLMMRPDTFFSRLYGSSAQSAVMKSEVCTARSATT